MSARIAVITGGTRGIGLAISRRLAATGHKVALLYRSDHGAAEASRAQLEATGAEVMTFTTDIANPDEVGRTIEQVRTALGPPTVLVNNAFAGGRAPHKCHEVPPQEWAQDLTNNLSGPFHVTQACLPFMVEEGFGRIVFIGSLASRGEPGRIAYATAKAALVGLSATVAREYARQGITSNVVNPGFIDAGAFERLSEEIQTRALKSVPSRRAGTREEVASLVSHLVSEDSGYLSGQCIGVNGAAL